MRSVSIILLCAAALPGCAEQTGQADQPSGPAPRPAAPVQVVPVERGAVIPQMKLVGAVLPARRSTVGSAVDGRVTEAKFEAGDAVGLVEQDGRQVGEPIAQLLTETISIEIAAAEAELEQRRQELAELEAGTRPEEIAQAEAHVEAARANERYASARYARLSSLYEQTRSVSQEDFEEARSAALSAQQTLLAAQAAYNLAVAGPRPEQIAQARAAVARQQEQVRRLEDMRKKYTIRAPFKGYVVAKFTEVGAWLSQGSPVAEIVELDPVDIEIQVPEHLISYIRSGDRVPVVVESLPAGQRQLEGVVDRIIPSADLRARTFPVRVRVDNPQVDEQHLLKAGMLAQVTVAGREVETLLVPKDALVLGGEKPVVVVAEPSEEGRPIARRVEVTKGVARGELIEVSGDLAEGDQVIVRGNERVQPGQPLVIAEN